VNSDSGELKLRLWGQRRLMMLLCVRLQARILLRLFPGNNIIESAPPKAASWLILRSDRGVTFRAWRIDIRFLPVSR
jgi:hypothetical protein